MKKIYHLLGEEPTFLQDFTTLDDLIVWTYRDDGIVIYSQAMIELMQNYYEN